MEQKNSSILSKRESFAVKLRETNRKMIISKKRIENE